MNNNHGTYTDANAVGDFGFRYLQGATNGPGIASATQYYGVTLGLGAEYSFSSYASQFYWPRTPTGGNPYISVRFREGGTWGSWSKIYAGYADSAGAVDFANLTNKGSGTGTYTTSGDYRAPIFYDTDNTGFYIDSQSTSNITHLQFSGTIALTGSGASLANSTGARLSENYGALWNMADSATWHHQVINGSMLCGFTAGGTNWGSGKIVASSDMRATIFYDYSNTGYYVDPNSVSNILDLIIANNIASPANYYNGLQLEVQATSGTAGIGLHRAGYSHCGIYHDSSNQLKFNMNNGTVTLNYDIGTIIGTSVSGQNTVDLRAPIFYDYNNTGYYLDPTSTSNIVNLYIEGGVGGIANDAAYPYAAIELRERGFGGAQDDTWATAPRISFHWGGRVASQIAMSSAGRISILNNPGNAYEAFQCGTFYSPLFYDSDNTGYYVDPSTTGDSIRVAGNIVAYYSDDKLKTKFGNITNAIDKICKLNGFYYEANETAQKFGYKSKREVGVSAQELQEVLPEVVKDAPIGRGYLTVDYERIVPLLIEAIKEQQTHINNLQEQINSIEDK